MALKHASAAGDMASAAPAAATATASAPAPAAAPTGFVDTEIKSEEEMLYERLKPRLSSWNLSRAQGIVGAIPEETQKTIALLKDPKNFSTEELIGHLDQPYVRHATDETGKKINLRADDGIHFSPQGLQRIASAVLKAIDAP